MPHVLKDQEIAMLRAELELLMGERQTLLRIAGAAASFVAELDAGAIAPPAARSPPIASAPDGRARRHR